MSSGSFVERHFESGDEIVVVRWHQPTAEPTGEYKCRWSISWPDKERNSHSCGLDSVQALLLAMRTAHVELVESDLYKAGNLTYTELRDLGLPSVWG